MTTWQPTQEGIAAARSLLRVAVGLSVWLGAGCFAHVPVQPAESPALFSAPEDGLAAIKMAFLMPPDQWEELAQLECETDPAGEGCPKLFARAAERLRWGVGADDAPALLTQACAQGHPLSCASVELLKSANLENATALARLGCPTAFSDETCHSAASLLAHSCHEQRQAHSCLVLAGLFAAAEPPNPVWTQHYRVRACAFGGLCDSPAEPPSRQPVQRAD
jgi:hypothetical protein